MIQEIARLLEIDTHPINLLISGHHQYRDLLMFANKSNVSKIHVAI